MKKVFVYRIIKYQSFQHHKSPTLSQTKFRMTESIVSVDNRQIRNTLTNSVERDKKKTNNPQTMNERRDDSLKAYISSIFIKKNIQKHYKKKKLLKEKVNKKVKWWSSSSSLLTYRF